MISLDKFEEVYACKQTTKDGKWELSKPLGGIKLKQRIKDAFAVLLNRGIVVQWYEFAGDKNEMILKED